MDGGGAESGRTCEVFIVLMFSISSTFVVCAVRFTFYFYFIPQTCLYATLRLSWSLSYFKITFCAHACVLVHLPIHFGYRWSPFVELYGWYGNRRNDWNRFWSRVWFGNTGIWSWLIDKSIDCGLNVIAPLFIVPACPRTDAIQTNTSVYKSDVATEGEWNLAECDGAHTTGSEE